jgi:hypothetical protein
MWGRSYRYMYVYRYLSPISTYRYTQCRVFGGEGGKGPKIRPLSSLVSQSSGLGAMGNYVSSLDAFPGRAKEV